MSRLFSTIVQAVLWGAAGTLVTFSSQIQASVPIKYQAIAGAVLMALSLAVHNHGVSRDPQGNLLAPPPK